MRIWKIGFIITSAKNPPSFDLVYCDHQPTFEEIKRDFEANNPNITLGRDRYSADPYRLYSISEIFVRELRS